MKFLITSLLIILGSQASLAQADKLTQHMTCSDGTYTISMDVDKLEESPKTAYRVYKGSKLVKKGTFKKELEEYEGTFLNAFIWEFSDSSDSIGIATPDFKVLQEGIWSGNADVGISTDDGYFGAATIDCKIEIY